MIRSWKHRDSSAVGHSAFIHVPKFSHLAGRSKLPCIRVGAFSKLLKKAPLIFQDSIYDTYRPPKVLKRFFSFLKLHVFFIYRRFKKKNWVHHC